jgi:hypothetical protein
VKSIYKDRTADLGKELDAIHAQNLVFGKRGANNNREARVEHQLGLNRLDEIMKELVSVAEERREEQAPPQNKAPKRDVKNNFRFARPILRKIPL